MFNEIMCYTESNASLQFSPKLTNTPPCLTN